MLLSTMTGRPVSLDATHATGTKAGADQHREVPTIIVTIDGPAGTGKSTTARALARALGLEFLDTGAMYRAAAALVIDAGIDPANEAAVVECVAKADLHFDWTRDPPEIYAACALNAAEGTRSRIELRCGTPLVQRIRAKDVEALVSPLSALPELRRHMVRKQRLIAKQHPRLVTEGRDQGSVVFPDALVKFFLSADASIRARRRAEQLREKLIAAGGDPNAQNLDVREIERDLLARDARDAGRSEGPLTRPSDALDVDTTSLTFDQVVAHLAGLVRERVGAAARMRP
ncbi:MAG: (d)CMP kinase [Phycisphaerales bacterium]|jgi:cytidylate kinase